MGQITLASLVAPTGFQQGKMGDVDPLIFTPPSSGVKMQAVLVVDPLALRGVEPLADEPEPVTGLIQFKQPPIA